MALAEGFEPSQRGLTVRCPAIRLREIGQDPYFGFRRSPTGSRTLFRDLKGRDLTHRRWGHGCSDACEI